MNFFASNDVSETPTGQQMNKERDIKPDVLKIETFGVSQGKDNNEKEEEKKKNGKKKIKKKK